MYCSEETIACAKDGELLLRTLSSPSGDCVIPLYIAPPAPPTSIKPASTLDSLPKNSEMGTSNSPVTPDGWIPVSDRLPPSGGSEQRYVLAADFRNHYSPNIPYAQVGVYGDWFNDGNPTWDDGDGEDLHLKEVTHWMELPAAPK
ncbi:DUF551 domain-containing protein [Kluyvera ascorbata]|uniref:DUF551 domain-containing protein n=2 Tax=Kluyvera ascorbata TaxID=51288 RepID=A0A3N2SDW6_9ENTR|nr:DUF551 domain-containing protein [Kluyvera ascorbata]